MISNNSLSQSLIESAARITDEDIESIRSVEIPELEALLNSEIVITKSQKNIRNKLKQRKARK
ncbi:MAG: hypothetical protein QNJ38_01330 [Prochloraceae cyanobacterium]|nr:hypothetical protein [Prochloraceae cyanobacterium]